MTLQIPIELPSTTLGLFIHDKRVEQRMSLRAFADRITQILKETEELGAEQADTKFSAGFLSDIENGKRFPSERVLQAIAKALGTTVEELNENDQRMPTEDFQRLQTLNPQYGFAFRRAVEFIKQEKLTPVQVLERIYQNQPPE